MQKIVITITAFVGALNVAFSFVSDTVRIVADVVKVVLGGAIAWVFKQLGTFLSSLAEGSKMVGLDSVTAKLNSWSASMGKVEAVGERIAITNNKTMATLSGSSGIIDGITGLYSKTGEAALKGADAIDKAQNKVNDSYKRFKDKRTNIDEDVSDLTTNAKHPNTGEKKKKSGAKGGDPQKIEYGDELKALDKFIANADKSYTRLAGIEHEKLKAMQISTVEYYDNKAKLLDTDLQAHEKGLQKELELATAYMAKAKNAGDKQRAKDKVDAINERIANDTEKFDDEKTKLKIEREKSLQDIKKKGMEYYDQYLKIMGLTYQAETNQINLKIDEILKSKDTTDELRAQLNLMRFIELGQAKINEAKYKQSAISGSVSAAEKTAEILKKNGVIGELDYLAKVRDIRQANVQAEKSAINDEIKAYREKLTTLENSGGDPTAILNIKTKVVEAQNAILELEKSTDPLAEKFNTIFNDSFGQFFDNILSKNKSVKQSFLDLFGGIEKQITALVSKNLLTALMKPLFGDNGGSGGGIGGFFSNLFGGSGSSMTSGGSGGGGLFSGIASMFGGSSGGGSSGGSGGGIGSLFSSIGSMFGGAFAEGGSVLPGKPILVGEKGAELWMPNTSGSIMNNKDLSNMSGGGSQNVIHIHVSGVSNPNDFKNSEGQMGAGIAKHLERNNQRNN
jgi:hypothetical protein